ncbi:MAG: transporter substrate-binding domain-containing protein, partial [Chloroflexota bacterium]
MPEPFAAGVLVPDGPWGAPGPFPLPKLVGLALIRDLNLTNLGPSPVLVEAYQRPFSFAVRDGNQAVLERLNQGVSIIKATGQYDEIYKKWFGSLELIGGTK